ncbi:CCCH zinc finger-containing SAC3/GANP/Nin1/mts3/eIF-3 p25 family protein [Klebsormidium nitens]|uniref:CCCH zinc finger-containing SAC3/GANP/Nin1/mts3/eIF-3 p25 family protein n=1 Tax=Klebsormidium nitens TaxID=105231 RepID=A0A1Y1I648_KLENI|nr:CCCH zinc finger-containing SAC3/GANP/Nin1/mts3/eIF-3 p25 family protein [Klebsormidium nitens]|eukprot:GAQ85973.1 CCCH zinc finger-containing SAC3/GANP/Nin1/mts3/eIF-3 p25 family protein [Klebsormidium nitens]
MTAATMSEEGVRLMNVQHPKSPRGYENAVKRLPTQGAYKTELCNKFETAGVCPYGGACQFAHGLEELRPVIRPPSFKTKQCEWLASGRECPYGRRCHFKHPTDETLPLTSLHVRAKSWDAAVPVSPKSFRELGTSNLGKKVLFSWESPESDRFASGLPTFNKSLSSERVKFVNNWPSSALPSDGQLAALQAGRRLSAGAIPLPQALHHDPPSPADLSIGLSRLSLSSRADPLARLLIPQPMPGSPSDHSDSEHSSPSKSQGFAPHLGVELSSPRKGPHSPRTTLTCKTSFEGSPRAFDAHRPLHLEPSSPLHHSPYGRGPLSFTEGLSPTRAQAELTDAFKRVKASGSSYSERLAQLQFILDALTRRGLLGTELHVRVLETMARDAVQHADWNWFSQCRAQLTRLPAEVVWSRDEFTAYLILQSYLSGALPVENLAALEDRYPVESQGPIVHALAVCKAVAAGDFLSFFSLREAAPNLNGIIMDAVANQMRNVGIRDILAAAAEHELAVDQMADLLGFRGNTAAFADWMEAEGFAAR